MKIQNKLLLSFLSVAISAVVIGLVAFQNILIIKDAYSNAAQETLPRLLKLENLRYFGTRIVYSTSRLALLHYGAHSDSVQTSDDWINELNELRESAIKPLELSLSTYDSMLSHISQDEKLYLTATRDTAEFLKHSSDEVIKKLQAKSPASELTEALGILENGEHAFEAAVDAQLFYTNRELTKDNDDVDRTIHNAQRILLISEALTLIFSITLGLLIARSLAVPIQRLVTSAAELGRGRFDVRAPEAGSEEIVQLARAFNSMADNLAVITVSKEQMNDMLRSVPDALILIDVSRHITWVNPTALALLKYQEKELLGRHIDNFIAHPDLITSMFASLIKSPYLQGVETTFNVKNGAPLPVSISSSLYCDHTHCGGLILVLQDITERKKVEDHLLYLANYDLLTKLPNRNLLLDRINQALTRASRRNQLVAILFCDLDGFKLINDAYGHSMGDHALQIAAQRLGTCVRAGDTVARHGGDEFVVALNELDGPQAACLVAQKIINALAAPFEIRDQQCVIGVSIGISIAPNDAQNAEVLLRLADIAMYRAKQQGKNDYRLYTPNVELHAQAR